MNAIATKRRARMDKNRMCRDAAGGPRGMTAAPQNGDFKIRIAQGVQTAAPLGRLPLFYHIISETGNRTIDIPGRYLKVLFIKKGICRTGPVFEKGNDHVHDRIIISFRVRCGA